jgi:hypothetical protein
MFSLQAYFDDSGAAGEQSVGGCVASAEAWSAFGAEWEAVLDRFHMDEFHAVRFENRRGQFATLPEADRTLLRSALLDVLVRHVNPATGGAFVCAVAARDFVAQLKWRGDVGRSAPKKSKTRGEIRIDKQVEAFSDPYCVCLGHVFKTILELAIGGQDSVSVFVAHQPKRTENIGYMYEWLRGVPRFRERLGGFQYGKDMQPKRVQPLQAADFAAYYLSKRLREPWNPVAWVAERLHPSFPIAVPFNSSAVAGWSR